MQSDSGYILGIDPIRLPVGLDMGLREGWRSVRNEKFWAL